MLELSNVKLTSINQIGLSTFSSLIKLDLSYNNLTYLDLASFQSLKRLQHLDLSYNQISALDTEIFTYLQNLTYLNLENNLITSIGGMLINYLSIVSINLSKNKLFDHPQFDVNLAVTTATALKELYLNNNQINSIKYLSIWVNALSVVNFDNNFISSIEEDALGKLGLLDRLSIANNNLSVIKMRDFEHQYNLFHLNLSSNRIEVIEKEAFESLYSLKELDLSYNRIYFIEDDLFYGLNNIRDLYLRSDSFIAFSFDSFSHMEAIKNIYINEDSLVELENKCLIINSLKRTRLRNISEYIFYYNSINLITQTIEFVNCELIYQYLEYNIHLNIKSEDRFEFFYSKCSYLDFNKLKAFKLDMKNCF